MQFGRVENTDGIDFSLPADHPETVTQFSLNANPKIYIGGAKWGRKDWVGKLYPPGTKEKDFLKHYAYHFNSIELNATHYNVPKDDWVKRWVEQVGENFAFCPKIPQFISHRSNFNDIDQMQARVLHMLDLFGTKLGHTFLQLSPYFRVEQAENLYRYLNDWPRKFPLAVEFRHESWYSGDSRAERFYDLMKEKKMANVLTDTSGRRDVLHMRLTSPVAFIRFVGNQLHPTDYTRSMDWIKRLNTWRAKGLEKVYFFIHQHDETFTPELSHYFLEKWAAATGEDISAQVVKTLNVNERKNDQIEML